MLHDKCELTELEVGFVRTDMVAAAEYALHDQSNAHGIVQAKLLGDVSMLATIIYHKDNVIKYTINFQSAKILREYSLMAQQNHRIWQLFYNDHFQNKSRQREDESAVAIRRKLKRWVFE